MQYFNKDIFNSVVPILLESWLFLNKYFDGRLKYSVLQEGSVQAGGGVEYISVPSVSSQAEPGLPLLR